MRDEEMKNWRCDQGHTLGWVVRKNRVRQLLLLREAMNAMDGEGDAEVMAVVEGYVADVRCSICGGVRTWVPGDEAMRKLLRQAEREIGHR